MNSKPFLLQLCVSFSALYYAFPFTFLHIGFTWVEFKLVGTFNAKIEYSINYIIVSIRKSDADNEDKWRHCAKILNRSEKSHCVFI
jgi:hypothetical protein